jgi:hypothetical protein
LVRLVESRMHILVIECHLHLNFSFVDHHVKAVGCDLDSYMYKDLTAELENATLDFAKRVGT